MADFRCENCGKCKFEEERANLRFFERTLFMFAFLIFSRSLMWSKDICQRCKRQYYFLIILIVVSLVALFLFFFSNFHFDGYRN